MTTLSRRDFVAGSLTAGAALAASSSVLGFEGVLNADANVVSGDSLAVTWTVTIS